MDDTEFCDRKSNLFITASFDFTQTTFFLPFGSEILMGLILQEAKSRDWTTNFRIFYPNGISIDPECHRVIKT